ncbi:MAG: site-specific integrase, partial [Hungatella hathewayi]|nr:site-specific integrase [Hungatella hathewayi]
MEERKNVNLTDEMLGKYRDYLRDEERSSATIEKYVRDVRRFMEHLGDGEFSRESVREYKQELKETYKITSANSMLAAVNSFLVFAGCGEWKVKLFKIQKVQYSRPEREISGKEYERLVH